MLWSVVFIFIESFDLFHNVYIVKMFVVFMKKLGCIIGLLLVLVSSFVVAGISISEPLEVYNLGDRLYISADGIAGAEEGNLNFDLVCGNRTTNLEKISARKFSFEETQSYSVPYKVLTRYDLEIANLSDVVGNCQVVVSLGADVVSTNVFVISDDVDVVVSLGKAAYNPGEAVTVRIEAIKANGVLLEGFVEGSNVTSFNKAISGGVVSEVFSLGETIEAGNYYLTVRAYDVGRGGILNEGVGGIGFSVNQVASSIIMSLGDVVAVPGESFTVGAEVYDQSGVEMEGAVDVNFVSPSAEKFGMVVQAGDFGEFEFNSSAEVGLWRVVGSFNGMIEEREFEMAGVQKAEFDFEGPVLTITNVGNVVYNRSINIGIGNESTVLDLNIGLGEVRKFNLKAPSGEYDVLVEDGISSTNHRVLLTGKAISVSDLKDVGIFKGYSIVWIFLIVVVGGVGFILFRRYRKTRTVGDKPGIFKRLFGRVRIMKGRVEEKVPSKIRARMDDSLNFTKKSPSVQGLDHNGYSHEDKTMVDFTKKGIGSAESTLVLKGEKYMSAVVAISVKDYDALSDVAKKALHEIIGGARKMKGLIDWRGDYVFVVFSPIVTKTYRNESLAVKAGMVILKDLNVYNKKFKDKIKFGIGVHVGELIASKEKEKLKYTSIGNTVSLAKRIADSGDGKLMVSDGIRKKLLRELKVSKGPEVSGNQVYEVSDLKNREADAARLKELLKRQG